MTETRLCECGCGRDACPMRAFMGGPDSELAIKHGINDAAGARMCTECADRCASDGRPGWLNVAERIRTYRRAQPKAKLEALDIDGNVLRVGDVVEMVNLGPDKWDRMIGDIRGAKVGIRYRLAGQAWGPSGEPEYPARGYRRVALRDGYSNATPPAPSAVEPKPNPLRGLAEAMRSLTHACMCSNCGRTCAAWRMGSRWSCCYCYGRRQNQGPEAKFGEAKPAVSNLDERIAAVQPAAVEEVRHPADWDVDPNAPDGCA